jgi:hypothetical protein
VTTEVIVGRAGDVSVESTQIETRCPVSQEIDTTSASLLSDDWNRAE